MLKLLHTFIYFLSVLKQDLSFNLRNLKYNTSFVYIPKIDKAFIFEFQMKLDKSLNKALFKNYIQ